jgi:hypothetical protein
VAQQNQLSALLRSAASNGFPIRAAIIASSSDLGSVTELWREPQTYARFLRQELSFVYHGPLLVVMTNGLGLVGVGASTPVDPSALAGVRIGAGGWSGARDRGPHRNPAPRARVRPPRFDPGRRGDDVQSRLERHASANCARDRSGPDRTRLDRNPPRPAAASARPRRVIGLTRRSVTPDGEHGYVPTTHLVPVAAPPRSHLFA